MSMFAGSFAFKLTVFLAVIAKTRTKLPWFGRCCCAWIFQLLGMVLWQFLIAMDTSLLLIDVLTSYTSKGWRLLALTMKVTLSMQLRTFLWCTHILEVARKRCYENLDCRIWQKLRLVLQVTQDAVKGYSDMASAKDAATLYGENLQKQVMAEKKT